MLYNMVVDEEDCFVCMECSGTGYHIEIFYSYEEEPYQDTIKCELCDGTGYLYEKRDE